MAQKAKRNGNPKLPAVSPETHVGETPGGRGPSLEEISRRAFEIYLERGAEQGRDLEDWLRAEHELLAT